VFGFGATILGTYLAWALSFNYHFLWPSLNQWMVWYYRRHAQHHIIAYTLHRLLEFCWGPYKPFIRDTFALTAQD